MKCNSINIGYSSWYHLVNIQAISQTNRSLNKQILSFFRADCEISKYNDAHKSGVLCQRQVSRVGTSNYILSQILRDVIAFPCLWLLGAHESSNTGCNIMNEQDLVRSWIIAQYLCVIAWLSLNWKIKTLSTSLCNSVVAFWTLSCHTTERCKFGIFFNFTSICKCDIK